MRTRICLSLIQAMLQSWEVWGSIKLVLAVNRNSWVSSFSEVFHISSQFCYCILLLFVTFFSWRCKNLLSSTFSPFTLALLYRMTSMKRSSKLAPVVLIGSEVSLCRIQLSAPHEVLLVWGGEKIWFSNTQTLESNYLQGFSESMNGSCPLFLVNTCNDESMYNRGNIKRNC